MSQKNQKNNANKKKICIVTFSNNVNYGGALQEFALYKLINDKYFVKCLDYADNLIIANSKTIRLGMLIYIKNIIKKTTTKKITDKPQKKVNKEKRNFKKTFISLTREAINQISLIFNDIIYYRQRKKLILNYIDFFENNLAKTKKLTEEELLNYMPEKFDVYISGSDQIWNPSKFGLSPIYFLSFIKNNEKKISYASSFGNYDFTSDSVNGEIEKYLSDYAHISVREKKSAEQIGDKFGLTAFHALDPTLMLDKKMWLNALKKKSDINFNYSKQYILVYMLGNRRRTISYAKKVGKKLSMPVYILDNHFILDIITCARYISTAGPDEFVRLFANASFVITNSFHGTAFAVNFNIPFYSVESTVPERVNSFLDKVKLQDRILPYKVKFSDDISINCDFSYANKILEEERIKSLDYLINAIQE